MPTFIDTSFLIAAVIENDELHRRALSWRAMLRGTFITSEFVLLEAGDGLSKPSRRSFAADIFLDIRNDPTIEIIRLDSVWLERGIRLFRARNDQEWGLTDCISFEIMRDHGVTEALTHDHHFEQAGFKALLRHDPPNN
jgi:predicted nucleic acid-binding protein